MKLHLINKDWYKFEFQSIFILSLLSIYLLFSSFNLITFYISLEFYSFTSIFLVFFSWRNSISYFKYNIPSLGLIYFLVNVIGSLFILFSFYFLYKTYNIVNFNDIIYIKNIVNINIFWKLFFISGFLIKLGCAPFHFWVLPLYNNIHSYITIFQSIIPKFLYSIIIYYLYKVEFIEIIMLISILTLIIGSCIGLKENKIKNIMGASSIFNLGLFLMILSSKDIIYNICIYFMNVLPILYILIFFEINRNNYFFDNSWNLKDLKNLPLFYPYFALLWMLIIFSLIGIPPFGGFFYKLNVFLYSIKSSQIIWLFIAIFATIISTIYYLYFIQYMYSSNHKSIYKETEIYITNKWSITMIFTIFSVIILFFYFYLPYIYYIFNLFTI